MLSFHVCFQNMKNMKINVYNSNDSMVIDERDPCFALFKNDCTNYTAQENRKLRETIQQLSVEQMPDR